jgi:DNA-binding transcriptional regulator YiaG
MPLTVRHACPDIRYSTTVDNSYGNGQLMGMHSSVRDRIRVRAAAAQLPPPASRRAIRELADLTLRDVAELLGASESAVLHWERGTRVPRPANARAYGELLAEITSAVGAGSEATRQR